MIIPKMIQEHMRLLTVNGIENCEELLMELGNYAVEQGLADSGFPQALLERERSYPTGIQASTGIAIPHSDQKYTRHPTIMIALLDKPVEFNPMGGGDKVPVEMVFLLLLDQVNQQVDVLGAIVSFIQDEIKMRNLKEEKSSDEIMQSLACFFGSSETR